MKRFAAGLLLGLIVAATPTVAEWGFGDMSVLQEIAAYTKTLVALNGQQAKSLERIAGASEW